jgi:hypothetical protein
MDHVVHLVVTIAPDSIVEVVRLANDTEGFIGIEVRKATVDTLTELRSVVRTGDNAS